MVALPPPKLTIFQDDKPRENRIYFCRYCKAKPGTILLLSQTQDHVCQNCYNDVHVILKNGNGKV